MNNVGVQRLLLQYLEGVTSWEILEKRIASSPTEQERGSVFELFIKLFLLLHGEYQISNAWLTNEAPSDTLEALGQVGRKDIGIDIVAKTIEGRLWAVQAKFRSIPEQSITYRELSTALASSDRANFRLVATNTLRLPPILQTRKGVGQILRNKLEELDETFFHRARVFLLTNAKPPIKRKEPKSYQKGVLSKAVAYFQTNRRGKIVLPPGTGKTLLGLWIKEALGVRSCLVLVPSLSLLRQTLEEWSINSREQFHYICVGSDKTVASSIETEDSTMAYTWELDVPVTTTQGEIERFLTRGSSNKVIFSTYQSAQLVSRASNNLGYRFDFAIYDEAHRTAQPGETQFSLTLNDERVNIAKRLFLTATPKLFSEAVKRRAAEEDTMVFSMDDASIYGSTIARMTFAEAIALHCLTDYRIIVMVVTDYEIRSAIEGGKTAQFVDSGEVKRERIETVANKIALLKAMKLYGAEHLFSFHNRIKRAQAFIAKEGFSIADNFHRITGNLESSLFLAHVNSAMTTAERQRILHEFIRAHSGLISNARCLTEGINVPDVDAVFFSDPKYSKVDIIQASGRALRLFKGKKLGYIIVPIILDTSTTDVDTLAKKTKYEVVWNVVAAMQSQDEELNEVIDTANILIGQNFGNVQNFAKKEYMQTFEQMRRKVEIADIPKHIDKDKFVERVQIQIIDKRSSNWFFMFGQLKQYRDMNSYAWPTLHTEFNGFPLGKWCYRQWALMQTNLLSQDRVSLLLGIRFSYIRKRRARKPKRNTPSKVKKLGISHFEESEQSWDRNLLRLKGFMNENEGRLPNWNELDEGKRLREWLLFQLERGNIYRHRGHLNPRQSNLLASLGIGRFMLSNTISSVNLHRLFLRGLRQGYVTNKELKRCFPDAEERIREYGPVQDLLKEKGIQVLDRGRVNH